MAEYHMLRVRAALYEEIQVAADQELLSVTAYVARALRLHLNSQKPAQPTTKPDQSGLSPQARAAITKEQKEKEAKDAERRAKALTLPEFHDGYEVYRYGITEGWDINNPGEGYHCLPDVLDDGTAIMVRMSDEAYMRSREIELPDYIPMRKSRELPDNWEDELSD